MNKANQLLNNLFAGINAKIAVIFLLLLGGMVSAVFLLLRAFYNIWQLFLPNNWWLAIIGITMLGLFTMLAVILLDRKLFIIFALATIAIFAMFFSVNLVYFIALLFFFIFLLGGYKTYEDEARLRVKMEIFWLSLRTLPLILTGVALIAAMSYYRSPYFGTVPFEVKIPRIIFNQAWMLIPQELIASSVGNNFSASNAQGKLNLEQAIELSSKPEAVYNEINALINSWIDKNLGARKQTYFSIAIVAGLFMGLKTLTFPLKWLLSLLTWGIVKLLLIIGVIKIEKVMVEKENIVI